MLIQQRQITLTVTLRLSIRMNSMMEKSLECKHILGQMETRSNQMKLWPRAMVSKIPTTNTLTTEIENEFDVKEEVKIEIEDEIIDVPLMG